jgi:N-acetylneuraminic acid mutarotase
MSRSAALARPLSTVLGLALILTSAVPILAAGRARLARHGDRAAGPLSLEERVAYQRAIEEVYWRHKIWPAENARPKPSLDEVMSPAAIRSRAEDALRASAALEAEYGRSITPEQLQAEMERMAEQTRQPELLRELFAALDDDPSVIAECLARPALAERLLRSWYAFDSRRHEEVRARAEADLAGLSSSERLRDGGGSYQEVEFALRPEPDLPPAAALTEDKALRLSREEWIGTLGELARSFGPQGGAPADSAAKAAADGLPVGRVGRLRESETRFSVVAVLSKSADRMRIATVSWAKQPYDAWWGATRAQFAPVVPRAATYKSLALPSGACAPDTWRPTAMQMPAREWHTAVWTGTEMIVWGGLPLPTPEDYRPAGRYNPATDTWTTTSNVNTPASRERHTAVWTGTEMIVWGGNYDVTSGPGTGGRYNPQTDTWTLLPTAGAPSTRYNHTAVWTGSKMIVWGGQSDTTASTVFNNGASYDPATGSWAALPTAGAPAARTFHTTVWTGAEMVVWGGSACCFGATMNTGGRYNPSTNQWTATTTTGAPSARYAPSAVWSGSEMIVWGGSPVFSPGAKLNTGGRYNPSTNSWTPTSTAGAPSGRDAHVAVWTGIQMLVWGGMDAQNRLRTGGRYTPSTNTWAPIAALNAPQGAAAARAVWTGSEMIVWGGQEPTNASLVNTGGRYNPQTDSWVAVNPAPNGGVRNEHPAVWTGTEMIVWGSYENFTIPTNTGARYFPATDTWLATSMVNVPVDRYAPIGVWTGTEMVVWGGCDDSFCFTRLNSGGRYNPQSDTWRPTSMTNAPEPRYWFSAVWTGSEILVWGGCDAQTCGPGGNSDPNGLRNGGRYNPATDTWQAMPVTSQTPTARWGHEGEWTGSQMIVWGGLDGHVGALGTGARFDLATNTWQAMSTAQAPVARYSHSMAWTGSELVVWGGTGNGDDAYTINTGGRYNPASDAWRPTSTAGAPHGRAGQTAVWTGTEMIVWGGCTDFNCQTPLQTGARYNPVSDVWNPTSTLNAPPPRNAHSAVWTGSEMIVFGGEWGARNPTVFDSGGRYCVSAPSFSLEASPTSLQATAGAQATSTVTVDSNNGFAATVSLSALNLPAGVTGAFAPSAVTPAAGGTASSTLTLTVGAGVGPGTYTFQVMASSGGQQLTQPMDLTISGAAPTGRETVGLYNPSSGFFFLRNSNTQGAADAQFGYGPGGQGWIGLSGDWDGDGDDTAGLYNPATGSFYLRNDNAPGPADVSFGYGPGGQGWQPVVGDWDGDGIDTVGLYVPASGAFFLRNANAPGPADVVFGYGPGGQGWKAIVGDWDGNGTDTVGVYAPASGFFFLRNTHAPGAADVEVGFGPGGAGLQPLAGDWDGDGITTIGLYEPATGAFFLRNLNAPGPADTAFGYGPGGGGLQPLAGDWDGL